jgi:hypothetical protein
MHMLRHRCMCCWASSHLHTPQSSLLLLSPSLGLQHKVQPSSNWEANLDPLSISFYPCYQQHQSSPNESYPTMSEKSDFQLDAHAQSPADQVDTSSQPKKKKTSRPRLWKAVYWYFCNNMANQMHRFAIDNAQKAYLARWDEVMVPDVENLVDWIKLFVVSGSART